jgi:hypothetical protein
MKKLTAVVYAVFSLSLTAGFANAAIDQARQAEVARRGADVMPFDLKATTHVFTKTGTGGVQQVVAKDADDARQIELIRSHLQEIAGRFSKGDYSAPTTIHGPAMPGLAELKAAKPSEINIRYREIKSGGEIEFVSNKQDLVDAAHRWFDAQLTEHGSDAMQGHEHSKMHH